MKTWVIGSGGLIGSAALRRFDSTFQAPSIPWGVPSRAIEVLESSAEEFRRVTGDSSWSILWAAGSATVGSTAEKTAAELATFSAALRGIRSRLPSGTGSLVLVSSAGGVYAGSRYPPFNSSTPIKPISPYGQLKAAQESTAIALLSEFCPVTIARVSNVYGPGQNLKKLQGLVSLAILATYQRQPLSIFVPLETRRDYLYVDDLSNMLYSLCKRETVPEGQDSTEILASGRSWSVAEILRIVEEITRRRVPVALGSHASSEHQPLDMSFSPSIRLLHESTPFAVGVKRVAEDIMRRVQHGTIAN